MAPKFSYLTKSPKGMYEYRKRVPAEYRAYFPRTSSGRLKAEWKQSLQTDDVATARKRWFAQNEKFEKTLEAARLLSTPTDAPRSGQRLILAKQLVESLGLLPSQAPILKHSATDEDYRKFKEVSASWTEKLQEAKDQIFGVLDDVTTDEARQRLDYESGVWVSENYVTPRQKTPAKFRHLETALSIMTGEVQVSEEDTWFDAVELYLATNKSKKIREPEKGRRWEVKTRSLLEKFGGAMGGMGIGLAELNRQNIREYLWREYPAAPTRNRYNNTLSAVMNCWNREQPKQYLNPFSGLSDKSQEYETATVRRSFKPAEWVAYADAVEKLKHPEIRLVGLLMLYTGCRLSEAAGIEVRDLKLESEIPHVILRTNAIRRMDKRGLERAVPLLPNVIEGFSSYQLSDNLTAPVFVKYGNTKGFDSISVALRDLLYTGVGIKKAGLVPYSARHTIVDRATAARVTPSHAEYIVGHKSEGSSAIHRRYGTKTPPKVLIDDLVAIFAVKDWGYYED